MFNKFIIIGLVGIFLDTQVQAASSFWCNGTNNYGGRIWLDVDYANNDTATIILTNEDYSGSTGETTYNKLSLGPIHCDSLGLARLTCTDNKGKIRFQDYPPNTFRMNLSEAGKDVNDFSLQFSSCNYK